MFVIPTTQCAWRVMLQGEPCKALRFETNAPVPTKLSKGEVLVKVQAAALNSIGYSMMERLPLRVPYIPEQDLAGVIVNGNGTELKSGDKVFGFLDINLHCRTKQGTLCQYTRLPASSLVLRPPNVSAVEAAGFGIVGLTAYQALFHLAMLEREQSVFINGGATATGSMAIQLAKAIGCKVTVSGTSSQEKYVRALGADEFVNWADGPLHDVLVALAPVPKFHVFFETLGIGDPALFIHSEAYLAPGGTFVSVGPRPLSIIELIRLIWHVLLRPVWLGGVQRNWKCVSVTNDHTDLQNMAKYIAEGKVKPIVDTVYDFLDVLDAYDRIESHKATGKVVIKVDPDID